MSYCKKSGKEGKDIIIFATKEDHLIPSKVSLPPAEPSPGLILPNGEINWNCPCLGGMATGPCGVEFRGAFSCFHYSQNEPKGAECLEQFQKMQDCMKQYPTLYKQNDPDIENSSELSSVSGKQPVENVTTSNTQITNDMTVEKNT